MEEVRRLEREAEIAEGLRLAREVFDRFVAPAYSQTGRATFYEATGLAANLRGWRGGEYVFYGAFDGEKLTGVAASRMGGSHVMLLFVAEERQGRGVARVLMQRLVADAPGPLVTVNAAPNAREAYARLGFAQAGPEVTESGMIFVPMEYRKKD